MSDHQDTPDENARPCLTCPRPLEDDEPRLCSRCHIRARGDVLDIVELYATLPDSLAVLTGATLSNHGIRSTAETPVVGGDALVMAARGSIDTVTSSKRGDRSHALDQWPTDPPSIAAVLGAWEDTFRLFVGDPVAQNEATVSAASSYILGHMLWATRNLEDWEDFAQDMRTLRNRLKSVTGDSDRPEQTNGECFECGSRIVRHWTDEGLADDLTCEGCGEVYDVERYMLTVKQRFRTVIAEESEEGFVTIASAARMTGRPERTIREWVRRGGLATKQRAEHIFVKWDDVQHLNDTTGRRARRSGSATQCA